MRKSLRIGCVVILTVFKMNIGYASAAIPQNSDDEKVLDIDSLHLQSIGNPLLTAFYKSNNYKTTWLNKKTTRQFLVSTLNRCSDDGLNPAKFELGKLNAYEAQVGTSQDSVLLKYDVLLTTQLQRYVSQMANGCLNPKFLYRDWDLKPQKTDINSALEAFEKSDSLSKGIERLQPGHAIYKSLRKALQILDSYPEDTVACIVVPRILYMTNVDPSLIRVKRKLMYWKDLKSTDTITAVFDSETIEAIKKFQRRHGIRVDGAIGKATVDALNFSKRQRREQIIANLERWKWFPRDFGKHYIIVNIPEYNLKVIKNNDTVQTKTVVVGTAARPTAVLSSTFNSIILNPTWTVPPTILEEDLVPSATKKADYFTTRNIIIYDSKNNVVSPSNWDAGKYKNYRYVQSPGDDNSLGNVKFNFPNRYSVYLHDTNHRDFFGKTFRSLSSGCVRVENPLPLAQYMINDKRWTMEKICTIIATKKTTSIPLKEKINIHQLYWTAWMDVDGTLQFRQDIYNLDEELYEKLRN